MSTNPEKAVSYVLSKYVTDYMNKDVLMLNTNEQENISIERVFLIGSESLKRIA